LFTQSQSERETFWFVDLQAEYSLGKIVIYRSTVQCCLFFLEECELCGKLTWQRAVAALVFRFQLRAVIEKPMLPKLFTSVNEFQLGRS